MKRFIVTILIIAVTAVSCFAHSADGHYRDWNKAFGIEDYTSKKSVELLWKTAQTVIDESYDDYIDSIQEACPWFRLGFGAHRILFHWGFNGDPRKCEPLLKLIENKLEEEVERQNLKDDEIEDFKTKEQNKLFDKLIEIQADNNRVLIIMTEFIFNIDNARGYSHAIATLVHNIHLLGDHTTSDVYSLPNLEAIRYDIDENGLSKLFYGAKSSRLSMVEVRYKEDMKQIKALDDYTEHDKKVNLLLETITKYLPVIINERFKNVLEKEHITIIEHFEQ